MPEDLPVFWLLLTGFFKILKLALPGKMFLMEPVDKDTS